MTTTDEKGGVFETDLPASNAWPNASGVWPKSVSCWPPILKMRPFWN